MFGSKRACPSGKVQEGSGPAKVRKEDAFSIYEATLSRLQLGSRFSNRATGATSVVGHAVGKAPAHENGISCRVLSQKIQSSIRANSNASVPVSGLTTTHYLITSLPQHDGHTCPCYVCTSRPSERLCFHCCRACCELCSRRCEGCQEMFCSICTTSNYEERDDRSFCFDCNTKNGSNNQPYSHSNGLSGSEDSCGMDCG